MKSLITPAALLAAMTATLPAQAAPTDPGKAGLALTEAMTTEVGPRLAGTEAEARARDWGVKRLRAMGFSNVRVEPFSMPVWRRGEERAEITAPFPQRLAVTALGRSGATPAAGLTGQLLAFESLAALEAAAPETVRGRLVYVTHHMMRAQDGSGYGFSGELRRRGPAIAARKGAAGIVIRSIGTDSSRAPHTGGTNWPDGVAPIPAGALSVADAELLDRMLTRGPVTLHLTLTPRLDPQPGSSGNVIAEIPGRDRKAGIVLVGGHLDSWDLGTGAIDDASGIGIVTGAAKAILDSKRRPRRTIRIVWFGAEEPGLYGGIAYATAHKDEPHALASEADFGADRIWRVEFKLPADAKPLRDRLVAALDPLGITPGNGVASGDSDVGPTVATGVNAVDLQQDGTRYFDLHHTPEDTFDKIDPEQFGQAAEAYARMIRLVADAPENLLPAKP